MKYIFLLLILLSIFGGILFYLYSNRKPETIYMVSNIDSPKQVLWHNNLLYIVSNGKYFQYDIQTRDLREIGTINENEIMGIIEDKLEFVSYLNIEIQSEEEYATTMTIKGKEYKYHGTIRPLSIRDNQIIAIDNYPNSPERKYEIDITTGDIKDYSNEYALSGENNIVISKKKKKLFTINKYNDVKDFYINAKEDKVAFVDNDGYLWIYIPAEILSKIL